MTKYIVLLFTSNQACDTCCARIPFCFKINNTCFENFRICVINIIFIALCYTKTTDTDSTSIIQGNTIPKKVNLNRNTLYASCIRKVWKNFNHLFKRFKIQLLLFWCWWVFTICYCFQKKKIIHFITMNILTKKF